MEIRLSSLTDTQLTMLEEMFPRHVLEYLILNDLQTVPDNMGLLANFHSNVSAWDPGPGPELGGQGVGGQGVGDERLRDEGLGDEG